MMLARRFPRPDVPPKIETLGASPSANGAGAHQGMPSGPSSPSFRSGAEPYRLEPLSAERYHIEFTVNSDFRAKLERARELLKSRSELERVLASWFPRPGARLHSVPSGDWVLVLERALDELIGRELKRRRGNDKPSQATKTRARLPPRTTRSGAASLGTGRLAVHLRGRRGPALLGRRFLRLEHRPPLRCVAPRVENLCALCRAHNVHTARQVWRNLHSKKHAEREVGSIRV